MQNRQTTFKSTPYVTEKEPLKVKDNNSSCNKC